MYADLATDNTTGAVYRALLAMVLGGTLEPGVKINQALLAQQLRVSRTPLVKALHRLETQGLVDAAPRKGFSVHRVTAPELLDLWSVREAVETLVAADVAENITTDQVSELKSIFDGISAESAEQNQQDYAAADRRFHLRVFDYSTNELALRINDHFQILNRAFVAGLLRSPSETLPEHLAIIGALERRDRRLARQLMGEHVGKTGECVRESIGRLRQLGVAVDQVTLDKLMP